MDLCVNRKMKCSAENAWKLLTEKDLYDRWYGTPVTDAVFMEGGFIRFAPQGDRPGYQSAIISVTEGRTFTICGEWTDETFILYPEADGCVLEKQITLKNGLVFTPDGLQQEGRMQEAHLEAFVGMVERTFPTVTPAAYAAPVFGEMPEQVPGVQLQGELAPYGAETPLSKQRKKQKAVRTAIILSVSFLVLICVAAVLFVFIGIPYMKEQDRIERYNKGAKAIEEGRYDKAADIFRDLGNYDDSEKMLAYAERGIRYDEAVQAMTDRDYRTAKAILDEQPDFKDSADLLTQCNYAVAFEDAVALADAGKYEEALKKLDEAGSNPDKHKVEAKCKEAIAHAKIREYIGAKKYAEALELLNSAEGKTIENYNALVKECSNGAAYAEALELYRDQMFYSAYNKFKSLGDYENAKSYMNSCVQNTPSTKELYKNGAYSTRNVSLKIQPPTNDGNYNYIKLYVVKNGEEILVSTVFIQKGGNYTVKLPAGDYVIKVAYGDGEWYGEKEMFGSNAVYERLQSTESSDKFTLKANNSYILTLRSAKDGNVRTKSESRKDF